MDKTGLAAVYKADQASELHVHVYFAFGICLKVHFNACEIHF